MPTEKRTSVDGIYNAYRYAPDLWIIEENKVRMFLFLGTQKALLVDTGFGLGNLAAFIRTLTDLPISIVNTHADSDHVGGNVQFCKAYLSPSEFSHYAVKSPSCVAGVEMLPLWEGTVLDLDTRRFEVISIPGHTPGSIALLDRENRMILTGDTISNEPVYLFAAGRNLTAYFYSLNRIRDLRGAFDILLPSHGVLQIDLSIIDEFIKLTERLLQGDIMPEPIDTGMNCKLYRAGRAKLYY